jgi:hypothetical protein
LLSRRKETQGKEETKKEILGPAEFWKEKTATNGDQRSELYKNVKKSKSRQ